MMRCEVLILWALLETAPLFGQSAGANPLGFLLSESKEQVIRSLGPPAMKADFGTDFQSWQFRIGEVDHDEFSHVLIFRKSTGELISVARNYQPERTVDEYFPAAETKVYFYPDSTQAQYGIRLRRLSAGRLLLAMGISKPNQPTGQLVLIRESELRQFYPWVFEQIKGSH